jgi:3'(2'), 5'-bisphosphate nucleotidase
MIKNIDLEMIKKIALEAGKAIMDIYREDFEVAYKEDKSPLTKADIKSNQIICEALQELYPSIPILSEENKMIDYDNRKNWTYYWCIDPIDGTKEFIKKNGEFTVNIALIYKDKPVLGVVYAPVLEDMYSAIEGKGAYKNNQKLPLKIIKNKKDKMYVVASKSHLSEETQRFIDNLDTKEIEQVGKGSSLKLCMVATGIADIYPRLAPTMEWDTAAADAIVRQSGKMTYQYDEKLAVNSGQFLVDDLSPLLYNKENLLNPWFVVV